MTTHARAEANRVVELLLNGRPEARLTVKQASWLLAVARPAGLVHTSSARHSVFADGAFADGAWHLQVYQNGAGVLSANRYDAERLAREAAEQARQAALGEVNARVMALMVAGRLEEARALLAAEVGPLMARPAGAGA